MTERRWYRLHWATWGALFLVCGTLLWRQTSEMPWGCDYVSGWPVKMLSNWSIGGRHLKVHTPGLILNFGVAAALLASTGSVLERWARHHWQLRVASWFRLIAVAGVLLALSQAETPDALHLWLYPHGIELVHLSPSHFPFPFVARAPILFALGCTIYTAGWLAISLVARSASTLRSLMTRAGKD